MTKRQLSPQEIDRRAGAISPQQYKKGEENRLKRRIRNYRATMQVSLIAAIGSFLLWFVINTAVVGWSESYGLALFEALFFCAGAVFNYFYMKKQLRKSIEALHIYADNRARGRIK